MRPSSLVISLLLSLFLLLQIAQGIRLEKEFMQLAHKKTQKEKISLVDNDAGNDVIVCKKGEGECSKGMNRKLITMDDASNMMMATSNIGEKSTVDSQDRVAHQHHDQSVMNLTEMDYSPPKRKSPIHN